MEWVSHLLRALNLDPGGCPLTELPTKFNERGIGKVKHGIPAAPVAEQYFSNPHKVF